MSVDLNSATVAISPETKPKKLKRAIASFLILFLILATLVGIMVFNLFNIRDRYVYPFLYRIPFIGGFIPISDEMLENFDVMTEADMIARINELEEKLYNANSEIKEANETIGRNRTEIERLKIFEEQQRNFKYEKADFDQRVALGDPQAYIEFFESVFPENAELLYPRAITEASRAADIRKFMNDISNMDEASAADALQHMIGTDMPLVVSIMQNMDSRNAGSILSEMDARHAASVMKMMAPFGTLPINYTAASPSDIVDQLTDLPRLP